MNIALVPRVERRSVARALSMPDDPARSDGFGSRLIKGEATESTSIEVLYFHEYVSATPGFEQALRARVRELRDVRHPVLMRVHGVHRVGEHGPLTLVYAHPVGTRLSELIQQPRFRDGVDPAVVSWVVQEMTPALAALQAAGPDIAHSTLSLNCVSISPDGRLCVSEHVLGSALRTLQVSPDTLWRDFAIVAPETGGVSALGPRADVIQLGLLALSLLLGRPVSVEDWQHRRRDLLEASGESAAALASEARIVRPLRFWLERALQLHPEAYASAADARNHLAVLSPDCASRVLDVLGDPDDDGGTSSPRTGTIAVTAEVMSAARMPPTLTARPLVEDDEVDGGTDGETSEASATLDAANGDVDERTSELEEAAAPEPANTGATAPARGRVWVVAAVLALVAIAEAGYIALFVNRVDYAPPVMVRQQVRIETTQPGASVLVDGRNAGATPIDVSIEPDVRAIRVVQTPPADLPVPIAQVAAAAGPGARELEGAAARLRAGGVRIVSPIELHVIEGDRLLGSTADGTVVTSAGTHHLDLVNAALGYKTRQTVTVTPGGILSLSVTPPAGQISVNAQPWARVHIDDTPLGDTPLANVPVPLGRHVVVFRHPQFGERREIVTVRADRPTRVSTQFAK